MCLLLSFLQGNKATNLQKQLVVKYLICDCFQTSLYYITSDGEYKANMLLSSFKLTILGKSIYRSGSSVDVLESTAWIREVIIHYQKKKKIGNPCHSSSTYSIKTDIPWFLLYCLMHKARIWVL